MLKPALLALFLLFLPTTPVLAYVTSKDVLTCYQHPLMSLVVQVEEFKQQGMSKADILKLVNPDITKEQKDQITQALNFVFDKKHEINASISAMVSCLNQVQKAGSVVL